ncbi:hypothetical protein LMG27177_01238 [Paraburkholderia fynbosensis]|uniref:Uncharacterized protein n=1 Tax=Paraburkholderia fynbosensis TaxID=1200993 RepID=A0A6J5FKL2_9BURK|nr:hypothetical protein LMG27177_01238 [Paraburkholderia fynbosensis]
MREGKTTSSLQTVVSIDVADSCQWHEAIAGHNQTVDTAGKIGDNFPQRLHPVSGRGYWPNDT